MLTRYQNATPPAENRTIGVRGYWLQPGDVSGPVEPLAADNGALARGYLVEVSESAAAPRGEPECGAEGAAGGVAAPPAPPAASASRKRKRKRKTANASGSAGGNASADATGGATGQNARPTEAEPAAFAELSTEALFAELETRDNADAPTWDALEELTEPERRAAIVAALQGEH